MSSSYGWSPPEKRKRNDSSWLQTLRHGVGRTAFNGFRSFFDALKAPFWPAKTGFLSSTSGNPPARLETLDKTGSGLFSEQSTSGLSHPPRFSEGVFLADPSQLDSIRSSYLRDDASSSPSFSLPFSSARNHVRDGLSKTYSDRNSSETTSRPPPQRTFTPKSPNDVNFSRRLGEKTKLYNNEEIAPISKISRTDEDSSRPSRGRQSTSSVYRPISERRHIAPTSIPISERNESLTLQRLPFYRKLPQPLTERSLPPSASSKSHSFAGQKSDASYGFNVPWSPDVVSVGRGNGKRKLTDTTLPPDDDEERRQSHWMCTLCSHVNHPFRRRCIHCLNPREGVCMTDYWKCPNCYYRNATALDECLLCRTPRVVPPKPAEEEPLRSVEELLPEQKRWQCVICLLYNMPDRSRCLGCGTPRNVYDVPARSKELNSTVFDGLESNAEMPVVNKSKAPEQQPKGSLPAAQLACGESKSDDNVSRSPSPSEEAEVSSKASGSNELNGLDDLEEGEDEEENIEEEEEEDESAEEEQEESEDEALEEEADESEHASDEQEEIIDLCSDSDGDEGNAEDEAAPERSNLNIPTYSEEIPTASKNVISGSSIVGQPEDKEAKRSEGTSSNEPIVEEKRSDAALVQPSLQALAAAPPTWLSQESSAVGSPGGSQIWPSSLEGNRDAGISWATPPAAYDTGAPKGSEQPGPSTGQLILSSATGMEGPPLDRGPAAGNVEATGQLPEDAGQGLNADASGSIEQAEATDAAPKADSNHCEAIVEMSAEPSSAGETEVAKAPAVQEQPKSAFPFQPAQQSGPRTFNFGQPLQSSSPFAFGQPSTVPSLFGASSLTKTTTSASLFNFGLSAAAAQQAKAPSFGNQAAEASGTGKGLFADSIEGDSSKRIGIFGQGAVGGQGFNFGQSSVQSFSSGAATSTTSIFGSSTPSTSLFGGVASTANIFGTSTSSAPSIFGTPTTTSSIFGTPTAAPTIFGKSSANATQNEDLFGQNALKQPDFNFGQKPAFGSTPFQPSSLPMTRQGDQQPVTTASSGFNFGTSPALLPPSSTGSSSSLFAASTVPSVFRFGQGPAAAPSLFQQQAASSAPNAFSFGAVKPAHADGGQQQSSIFTSAAPLTTTTTTTSAFPWASQMASSSSAPTFGSSSAFQFGGNAAAKSGEQCTAGQSNAGEATGSSGAIETTGGARPVSGLLSATPNIFNAAGTSQAQSGTAASGRRMIYARRRVRRC